MTKLTKSKYKNKSIWEVKHKEFDWLDLIDKFFINLAPKWFSFIEWITLTGFLFYLVNKYENNWIKILYIVSQTILLQYILRVTSRWPYYKLLPTQWMNNLNLSKVFSVVIGSVIYLLIYLLIINTVIELSVNYN
jgi:hypothetical protein